MASIHPRQQKRQDGTLGRKSYMVRYRDPDGQPRSQSFKLEREARHFKTKIEHSTLTGSYVDPRAGKESFRDYAEKWRKVQPHRDGTATSVELQLRLHVYPHIGERPIGAIRPSEIQALLHQLRGSLSASTIEVVFGRVVAVFRAALRDHVIAINPCAGIRPPRQTANAPDEVLSTENVFALADSIHPRYRGLVLTGAGTGMRPGELFGLTVPQVGFLQRSVRVDQQLVRVRGEGIATGPLKTAASYRKVPLAEPVAAAIAAHLAEWGPEPTLNLVFSNTRGAPIQQSPFATVWETARTKAGLPDWATPHDLRHYYASVLIRSGASVKVVQQRLGHSSAKTTLDVYGHLFEDEEDRTRTAIENEFEALASYSRPEEPSDEENLQFSDQMS